MKNLAYVVLCIAVCAIVLAAGCTQNTPVPVANPVATAPVTQSLPSDSIKTTSSSLGTILTDARGMTLYFFARDRSGSGNSTCYGKCATIWPVYYTTSPVVSPPLAASDFTVITRADGTPQTSYKGWPLYYYQEDTQAGDMKGEGITGNWFVAKPDYSVMLSQQPGAGEFLTDGAGRTLYFFASDNPGATACTGSCISNWPAFSSGPLIAPSILKTASFSGGKRQDGRMQSLYQDRPLYYFIKDTKPGDMNGQGVNNVWFVANMSGFVPPVPTTVPTIPPTPTPTPTFDYGDSGSDSGGGGGGGY